MTAPSSPEERLADLASAIIQGNAQLADSLIQEGIPLSGQRLSMATPPGVPGKWFEEGLSPLTWVVTQMIDIAKAGDTSNPYPNPIFSQIFGVSQASSMAKTYSAKDEKSLDALSQIGGALLLAGASQDVRLGRTARSQKAIEALNVYLPEYATGMRAAANRRLLAGLSKKKRPLEEEEEPYRPRL